MRDATGRNLREGQYVQVCLQGVFTGNVQQIVEPRIHAVGMDPGIPVAFIIIPIPLAPDKTGKLHGCYIVEKPEGAPEVDIPSGLIS